MRGAEATSSCPTDTIANAGTRMSVVGPLTIEQYEQQVAYEFTSADEPERKQYAYKKVEDFVRDEIGTRDEIYDVSYYSDPDRGRFWGFSGYVVSRDECVIHVSQMSYIN